MFVSNGRGQTTWVWGAHLKAVADEPGVDPQAEGRPAARPDAQGAPDGRCHSAQGEGKVKRKTVTVLFRVFGILAVLG